MKGMVWTHGLSDNESYLDVAYSPGGCHCILPWANGAVGAMVDIQGDNVLRFVDYYYEPEQDDKDYVLLKNHTTEEDELACPVVAEGVVVYWLKYRRQKGTAEIFEEYFNKQKRRYVERHKNEPDAWERNLEEEFATYAHIHAELERIERSVQAVRVFIDDGDTATISAFADNYLRFVRRKAKTLFPPKYPENRKIEDEFLATFSGPAEECMDWIREEHDIPYVNPNRYGPKSSGQDQPTQEMSLNEYQLKWKRHHDIEVPRYVAWGFEDYNRNVLYTVNGGLFKEIETNLRSYKDREDQIRYAVSLLQPFKDFADAFYPMGRIREKEREIEMHERDIERWTGSRDNVVPALKKMIEHCRQDIEYWNEVEQKFYDIVQGAVGDNHAEKPMELYLFEFWHDMITFARKLAALLLTFHIRLSDVQEQCGIYLLWPVNLHDYVDRRYVTDFAYARQLLAEIEAENAPQSTTDEGIDMPAGNQVPSQQIEMPFNKTIFHDRLVESKIAHALSGVDRMGCGVKQFTQVAQEFFESIGWLVNRTDTDFVSWMKHHQIVSMKAKGLTHVQRNQTMDSLADILRQTFQFKNGKGKWEDNFEFYKKDRLKINNGL